MQNKILPILCIFIIIISFSASVFATSNYAIEPETITNETFLNNLKNMEEYKSGNYYCFVGRDDTKYYKICYFPKSDTVKFYRTEDYNGYFLMYASEPGNFISYKSTSDGYDIRYWSSPPDAGFFNYSNDFYATTSIYTNDTYTDFFIKAPVKATIPALETVEQIPEAITKTLQVMIPVGLVILSMVLVVYLIKSVILRMT